MGQLKISATRNADAEINIRAVIPFDGTLIITRNGEKKAVPFLNSMVTKGFFFTNFPTAMHDETHELLCTLRSDNTEETLIVELEEAEDQD